MHSLETTSQKSGIAAVAPWLIGAAAAFVIRMALSVAGTDTIQADTIAMFSFIGISLGHLAIPQCARVFGASPLESTKREKAVALGALALLIVVLAGFAFFAYLHGVRG